MAEILRTINQENLSKFFINNYKKIGSTPAFWSVMAFTYKECAEVIYVESIKRKSGKQNWSGSPYFQMVSFYLYGVAIENSLKARLLKINDGNISDYISDDYITDKLKTHELENISKQLDIEFIDKESQLLKILNKYILWAAKYPIPRNKQGYFTKKETQNIDKILNIDTLRELFNKINKDLL